MAALFAAVFLLLWWRGNIGRHALAFAVAYALLSLGLIMVHFGLLPDILLFHSTQLLYSIATGLLIWGAAQRVGAHFDWRLFAVPYVASALALVVLVSNSPAAGPQLIMSNIGYGVMFVMGAMILASAPRRGPFDVFVIVMLVLNAIDFLVRPTLTTLTEEAFFVSQYQDSLYYSVINLALSVKTVLAAFVLIGACLHDMVENMRADSARDAMTGLFARRAFEEEVREKLALGAALQKPVSLIVADIDHFKQVNDIWGHQAGDKVITSFGKLIAKMVREEDICGRIGGEEFCILVWDCEEQPALQLAERIRMSFAAREQPELGENFRLSASFGVATMQPGENYQSLVSRADAALYDAKDGGRNRVSSEACERRGSRRAAPVGLEDRAPRQAA